MTAIELGCPYSIVTPGGGVSCYLNQPTVNGNVGYVTEITGLDAPGVRENAQVTVAGDGGHHGPFWKDRRPWTVSGIIYPVFPLLARDQAQELLEGVVMACMQADGTFQWTPVDGVQRQLSFRAQQPPRISTGQSKVEKTFQIACVTADWRVVSSALQSSATGVYPGSGTTISVSATNIGNADAAPIFTINGPVTNPVITDTTTGKALSISGAVASGNLLVVDLSQAYPVVTNAGSNWYGSVTPTATDWGIAVAGTATVTNGANTFQLSGSAMSTGTTFQVQWRHSWV